MIDEAGLMESPKLSIIMITMGKRDTLIFFKALGKYEDKI